MFRATTAFLRVSAYSAFLTLNKGKFSELPIAARGKHLAKLYKNLGSAESLKLRKYAMQLVTAPKVRKVRSSKPSKYNNFVSANWKTVKGTQQARIVALAKRWNAAKKKNASKK